MSKNGVSQKIQTGIKQINKELDKTIEKTDKLVNNSNKLKDTFDDIKDENKDLSKDAKDISKNTEKIMKNLSFDSLVNNVSRLYRGLEKVTKSTMDYLEDLNLLKVAFGDTADEAYNLTKHIASITGFNEAGLVRNLATFRNLTSTLALTNEQADLLATNLEKMSLDISSLYNVDVDRAAYALTGMLTGQPRTIKTLTGANITNKSLDNELAIMGINRKASSLNQAEKAIVSYLALERQLANSNGDLARTIEQPAQMLRVFKDQVAKATRSLGTLLLPILKALLPYLTALLMVFNAIVDVIATLFGIDADKFWKDMEGGAGKTNINLDELQKNLNGTANAAKKAKMGLRGFDKLNVISTPSTASGSGGLGIDPKILNRLKEYELGLEKINTKAKQIAKSIMEWLGFTKDVNGEWKFSQITLGTIVGSISGIVLAYGGIKKIAKVLGKVGGVLGLGGKATTTTNTTKTILSIKNLGVAFDKLANSIGVSSATLGGFLTLLGLAVGTGIYLNTNPAIQSFDELSKASEKAKKMLTDINTQFRELSKDLKKQNWTNKILSKKDVTNLKNKIKNLTSTIKDKLEEQKNNALSIYDETLKETIGEKAYNKMISKTKNYYDGQAKQIDNYEKQILSIQTKASNEKRALTEDEVATINDLYEKMKTDTIKNLSESANEAELILWRMKENATAISAEQASEILKESIKTRDEAIKNAKEQYEKVVFEAYKLKEAGAISEEEYEKIRSASQTTRDEAIKNAKEQHQKVYDEFAAENKAVADYIDKDTGGIKSKWKKLWSDLHDTSKTWKDKIKTIWDDLFKVKGEIKVAIKDEKGKTRDSILEMNVFGNRKAAFASGGFPEDGLFYANHNEMVGKFINGKTAVANNDQIVKGISQGVRDAIISTGGLNNRPVIIQATGDANGLMNFIKYKQKEDDMQYGY